MGNLFTDYSGKFDPDFSHDKFTGETLSQLLRFYSKFIHRIDATWYLTVLSKWGNEEALDCDIKVLEKMKIFELTNIFYKSWL